MSNSSDSDNIQSASAETFLHQLITFEKNRSKDLSAVIERIQVKLSETNTKNAEVPEKLCKPTNLLEKMQFRVKMSVGLRESKRLNLCRMSDQELIDKIFNRYKSAWKKLSQM
jgi:hypothetical protein